MELVQPGGQSGPAAWAIIKVLTADIEQSSLGSSIKLPHLLLARAGKLAAQSDPWRPHVRPAGRIVVIAASTCLTTIRWILRR